MHKKGKQNVQRCKTLHAPVTFYLPWQQLSKRLNPTCPSIPGSLTSAVTRLLPFDTLTAGACCHIRCACSSCHIWEAVQLSCPSHVWTASCRHLAVTLGYLKPTSRSEARCWLHAHPCCRICSACERARPACVWMCAWRLYMYVLGAEAPAFTPLG